MPREMVMTFLFLTLEITFSKTFSLVLQSLSETDRFYPPKTRKFWYFQKLYLQILAPPQVVFGFYFERSG